LTLVGKTFWKKKSYLEQMSLAQARKKL